jgi:hypothetical protein
MGEIGFYCYLGRQLAAFIKRQPSLKSEANEPVMRIPARTRAARSAAGIFASWSLLGCAEEDPATGSITNAYASERTVNFFDDFLGTSIDTTKWTILDRLSDQANHEVNCVIPGTSA